MEFNEVVDIVPIVEVKKKADKTAFTFRKRLLFSIICRAHKYWL